VIGEGGKWGHNEWEEHSPPETRHNRLDGETSVDTLADAVAKMGRFFACDDPRVVSAGPEH